MTSKAVPALTSASTPLGGTEELHLVQSSNSRKATATDIATLAYARSKHTGTQLASTISDFSTAADARITAATGVSVQAYSANLTTLAGVTPGATGLALLDDASASAARTTLALQGFSSATSVNTQSGTGSFRQRITASDAPTDLKTFEVFQSSTTGSISYSLMSDTLNMRQNWVTITRSDKIYFDWDYVHPDDAALDKYTLGGTGGGYMTLEVDFFDVPITGRAIRGISGDPDGTLEYPSGSGNIYGAAGVPGVTHTAVPADWVPATLEGNFDGEMGNTPSNAKMVENVYFTAEEFGVMEKTGGSYVNRGALLGCAKNYDLETKWVARDFAGFFFNVDDGGTDYYGRAAQIRPHRWWQGGTKRMELDSSFDLNLYDGGINFGQDTLECYDEGTFTPVLVGTTSAGTGTYSTQSGRYTRIGRIVHFELILAWSAHTGTGNMRLDLGAAPTMAASPVGVFNIVGSGITGVSGTILGRGIASTATADLLSSSNGTAAVIAMDTAGTIWASGIYTAA